MQVKIDYSPRKLMVPFHETRKRFGVLVCHRRLGKTVAAVNHLIRHVMLCDKPNPRGVYVAPTFSQAKDIAWGYLKQYTQGIPGMKYQEAELRADFPNGGRIKLYGSENPDRMRGLYLDIAVIDEFASMKPDIWETVIRPALSDRQGSAFFLGTPKGLDSFYDLYRHAVKHPEDWFSLMLKASETGILPKAELEDNLALMDTNTYLREFECSFDVASSSQYISKNEIETAYGRSGLGLGPIIVGCDVARYGEDRTVICVRNGDIISYIGVWQNLSIMRTAAQLMEIINEFKPQATMIDGVGVGGGVVDRIMSLGYNKVFDINSARAATDKQRYSNLRAESWGRMRIWLKERAALADLDYFRSELSDDLASLNYDFDRRDRLKLESKDELKARGLPSPDLADALALTFSHRLAPPDVVDLSRRVLNQVPMSDPLQEFTHA